MAKARVKYVNFEHRDMVLSNGSTHEYAYVRLQYVDVPDQPIIGVSMTMEEFDRIKNRIGNDKVYGSRKKSS